MVRVVWVLASLPLLLPLRGAPVAAPESPEVAALACTVSGEGSDANVHVIGGYVAGRGWLESEQTKGLMKAGDRLTLYALEAGTLGDVILTSDATVGSERPADPVAYRGLSYNARIRIHPDKQEAYAKAKRLRHSIWKMDMVAVWSKADPRPPWIVAQLLPGALTEHSEYRALLADWFRSRHVDAESVTGISIEQAVRADINRDGRGEVLLSFLCEAHWEEGRLDPRDFDSDHGRAGEDCFNNELGRPEDRYFSFLVMRCLPGDARQVETAVLHNSPACRTLWVIGFCDLDGDGTAEVLTRAAGRDYDGAQLFHWDGERFHELDGYGAGV